ncbi:hypothetical protein TGDOM2_271920 [Toxoplasma gondii GAB2-2007-GAL-DOM2]|uniref:Uncharacterized protein n=5 Tax=Toxoplasma gondii TaxID=5811 RepID=S7V3V2_TOXGG|nr:hypothetical protein TGGT1_271920 [Toxoplasma gondii GT1]KAF4642156.1 hypothetical protein TGRH88_079690 [Toxoplasma gondii]KFG43344.1 hypothetical protein TGDOM2_271920 [Toxoplasma gondii GAB2-2007-GAL-DOM2]KFG50422.1 hypothetical protein TGFOU_271920 [Toxoplasma gondii FOU]
MVLLPLDEFSRSFFQFNTLSHAPDFANDPSPRRPAAFLVFCTPEVDSVCCCHLLSTFLNSRLLFLDSQWDCRNVALDIEFVGGIPDVLAWIDRHLDYHLNRASALELPAASAYRLPFYDRILFIGLGGLSDEDELDCSEGSPGAPKQAGLTATLFAAVTDLFLNKAVHLEAVEELKRQRRRERAERLRRQPFAFFNSREEAEDGRRQPPGSPDDAADEAADVLTPEDEERVRRLETKLRNSVQIAVLDARRPVHNTLLRDGRWIMPMEEAEQEALERRRRELLESKGLPSLLAAGVYRSKPCAAVLAKVLEPLYEVESSAYAFAGATAAAAFLQEEWMSSDDYNDLIMAIKDINVSTFPYIEDDDNNGLLPLLRNGCLRDSLSVSSQLLFLSLGHASGDVSRSWATQQQSNELRVQCGLECKDMVNPFSGLAASQQRVVYDYLRQTLQLRDCYCLNWAKDRGNLPSVPNVDIAFLIQALLAKSGSHDAVGAAEYRTNAIEALQLLTRITSTVTREQNLLLQQLEKTQSLVVHHRLQLFRHLDLAVLSHARGGVLLATLRHPRTFLLHPAYIRAFALLCSLKQAGGDEEKRLPVVLHIVVEAPGPVGERSILYACTPNADAESPDLFPFVLHLLVSSGDLAEGLARRRGGKRSDAEHTEPSAVARCVKRDGGCPHMLHVAVGRLGSDVQKQIAAVYVNEVRRRAEAEAREDGDDDDLDLGREDEEGEENDDEKEEEDEKEVDTETGRAASQEDDDKEQRDLSNWASQGEHSEEELSEHEAKRRHSESFVGESKMSQRVERRGGGTASAW